MYKVRLADLNDVDVLVQLESANAYDELANDGNPNRSSNNLEAQTFSRIQLLELINHHWLVVALDKQQIIGYVVAAKWHFFNNVSIYKKIINILINKGINHTYSCQYGPIWVNRNHRGKGVFCLLVDFLSQQVADKFPMMVTFIAENNEVSFAAHTAKADMEVIDYFEFERRDFYLLKKDLLKNGL